MATVTRYNALECSVLVDDVAITGVGEDYVSGEKDEDYFSPSVGAQGDTVKHEIVNDLGQITITIQSTSPQRAFLMSLAKKKETFPIWVINKELGERFGGTMANLLSAPSLERGTEAGDMEFVFQVFDYTVEATK